MVSILKRSYLEGITCSESKTKPHFCPLQTNRKTRIQRTNISSLRLQPNIRPDSALVCLGSFLPVAKPIRQNCENQTRLAQFNSSDFPSRSARRIWHIRYLGQSPVQGRFHLCFSGAP